MNINDQIEEAALLNSAGANVSLLLRKIRLDNGGLEKWFRSYVVGIDIDEPCIRGLKSSQCFFCPAIHKETLFGEKDNIDEYFSNECKDADMRNRIINYVKERAQHVWHSGSCDGYCIEIYEYKGLYLGMTAWHQMLEIEYLDFTIENSIEAIINSYINTDFYLYNKNGVVEPGDVNIITDFYKYLESEDVLI